MTDSEEIEKVFAATDDPHPDPPAAPDGWEGGGTEHSGGSIVVREWVNEELGLRVSYNLTDYAVVVERVSWDDDFGWEFDGNVAREEHVECDSDRRAMVAAFDVMERITDGEVKFRE